MAFQKNAFQCSAFQGIPCSILITDAGHETEVLPIINKEAQTDNGAGAEISTAKNMLSIIEGGSVVEIPTIKNAFSIFEVWDEDFLPIRDSLSIKTVNSLPESGSGIDTPIVDGSLIITDLEDGVDTLSVSVLFSVNEYNCCVCTCEDLGIFAQIKPVDSNLETTELINIPAKKSDLTDAGASGETPSIRSIFAIPDSQSGTDTFSIRDTFIITDFGSRVEVPAIRNIFTSSDSGSGADIASILARLNAVDSLTGSEIVNIPAKGSELTEAGSGTELFTIENAFSLTDSGARTETTTIENTFTITDSGSRTESPIIKNTFSLSDSGTFGDLISIKAFLTMLENMVGSDVIDVPLRSPLITDGGVITETTIINNEFVLEDSNHNDFDENISIENTFTTTDSGTGNESTTILAELTITDTDIFAVDLAAIRATVPIIDSSAGTDLIDIPIRRQLITQSGAGAEGLSLTNRFTLSESSSANDLFSIRNTFSMVESGTGTETPTIKNTFSLTDSGSGIDLPSLLARLSAIDSGSAVEVMDIPAKRSDLTESGSGAELPIIENTFSLSDSGALSEGLNIENAFLLSDSGAFAEGFTLKNGFLLSESGNGADILSILARITATDLNTISTEVIDIPAKRSDLTDSSIGTDIIAIENSFSITDTGTDSEGITLKNTFLMSDTGYLIDVLSISTDLAIADSGSLLSELVDIPAKGSELYEDGALNESLDILNTFEITDAQKNLFPADIATMNNPSAFSAGGTTPPTIELSTDYAYDGNQSYKIQWNHTGGNYYSGRVTGYQLNIPSGAGMKYSIWIYSPTTFNVTAYVTGGFACCYRTVTVGPSWQKLIFNVSNDYYSTPSGEYITFYAPSAASVMYVDLMEATWSDGFKLAKKSQMDDLGQVSEQPVIENTFSLTDSGIGSDLESVLAHILTTDINTLVTEDLNVPAKRSDLTDTGSVSETSTIKNTFGISDNLSGSDIPSIKNTFSIIDTGNDNEILTLKNTFGLTEASNCTEIFTILARISLADIVAGTEVINIPAKKSYLTETGVSNELPIIRNAFTVADINSLIESLVVYDRFSVGEMGVSYETPTIHNFFEVPDSGGLYEEEIGVTSFIPISDNGAINEFLTINGFITIQDSINTGLEEDIFISNELSLDDLGMTTEEPLVENFFILIDEGFGIDDTHIRTYKGVDDSLNGFDILQSLKNLFLIQQNAISNEVPTSFVRLAQDDSGTGIEELLIGAKITLTEINALLEELGIRNTFSVEEAGISIEEIPIGETRVIWDDNITLESILRNKTFSISDDASFSEKMELLVRFIIEQDSQSSESLLGMNNTLELIDSGTGEELVVDLLNKFVISENSTANENIELIGRLLIDDVVTGIDESTQNIQLYTTDSAQGYDSENRERILFIQEDASEETTILVQTTTTIEELCDLVDSFGIKVSFTISQEAFSQTEINILSRITITDSESIEELITILSRINIPEVTETLETIRINNTLNVDDSQSLLEVLILVNKFRALDVALSDEIVSHDVNFVTTDLGSALEELTEKIETTLIDIGEAGEVPNIFAQLLIEQDVISTDTFGILSKVDENDSGIGEDLETIYSHINLGESPATDEEVSWKRLDEVSDNGISSEEIIKGIVLNEEPIFEDEVSIISHASITTDGSGLESLIISADLLVSDVGSGIEFETILSEIAQLDFGYSLEETYSRAFIYAEEYGIGTELVRLFNHLRVEDSAHGVDAFIHIFYVHYLRTQVFTQGFYEVGVDVNKIINSIVITEKGYQVEVEKLINGELDVTMNENYELVVKKEDEEEVIATMDKNFIVKED